MIIWSAAWLVAINNWGSSKINVKAYKLICHPATFTRTFFSYFIVYNLPAINQAIGIAEKKPSNVAPIIGLAVS